MASVHCPSCGRPNEAGVRFCTFCGASTEPRGRCASCNTLQSVGNTYCMSCGQELSGHSMKWDTAPAAGAVIDGEWQRSPEELIRRVDPEDTRTFLGNRVVRVPSGTVGVVLVDGVVERVLGPGQQTTVNLFQRIAEFFTRRERTAFYLIDLRPIPVPFSVQTRAGERGQIQTQVLVTFSLQRGNKEGIGTFIQTVLGARPAFAAADLYNQLRPEVARIATHVLERWSARGEVSYPEAEAEIRREITAMLGARYGLGVDVSVAPLTTTASLDVHLGAGASIRPVACAKCGGELPPTMKFCDRCGEKQPSIGLDRACGKCGTLVPVEDKFCAGCGATFTPMAPGQSALFTADGEQIELDLVLRVQGPTEVSIDRLAPAISGAAAAALRRATFAQLSTRAGFAALEDSLKHDLEGALSSFGLRFQSITVVDVRSKKGEWTLNARSELEHARAEVTVGREWLSQRSAELDLSELTHELVLRQQRAVRDHKLAVLESELGGEARERALRSEDAFRRELEALDDRRRKQDVAAGHADLDVADATRTARREIDVAGARRSVERDDTNARRQDEMSAIQHDMAKESAAFEHESHLTRGAMGLEAEKRRQETLLSSEERRRGTDDAVYAKKHHGDVDFQDHARRAELDAQLRDREEARQLEKLRGMAEIDRDMAAQEHAHVQALREQMKGLSEREMIALQATELARATDGGAAWARALSSEDQVNVVRAHASEVKELMKEQLDRVAGLAERALDQSGELRRRDGSREVYESSMQAMSSVAAARAQPAPVVAAVTLEHKPCKSCGVAVKSDRKFCGSCGAEQ